MKSFSSAVKMTSSTISSMATPYGKMAMANKTQLTVTLVSRIHICHKQQLENVPLFRFSHLGCSLCLSHNKKKKKSFVMHLRYLMHLQPCGTCVRWNMELNVDALLLKGFCLICCGSDLTLSVPLLVSAK